ncbi:hypothetical protein KAU55_00655 [Candidatus Bathyarchaeota archaeon]|nr:hypothetical protein [Candidatus Bathyarchaeota archaeon]
MTGEKLKCPLSGIYCDECGILHAPDIEGCPIVEFNENLAKLTEALEKLFNREE